MKDLEYYKGYQRNFLGPGFTVSLPILSKDLKSAVAPVKGSKNNVLNYQNFSLVQNAQRRFPFFTASNIDGSLFKKLPRFDDWRIDPRIDEQHQWGSVLYTSEKSEFDKGHMAKREDAQWGQTDEEAQRGALSTFFYTNAVPQVAKLNQQLWRGLEDYILKSETVCQDLKINLFTGPVLSEEDPLFVTEVEGQHPRIPTLFWKVIYYTKSDGHLYRVGFLMGQEELLQNLEIVQPRETSRDLSHSEEEKLFMKFKQAEIFQVNISTIRKLTKLRFTAAIEPYKDDRPVAVIQREVQGRGLGEKIIMEIEGLIL